MTPQLTTATICFDPPDRVWSTNEEKHWATKAALRKAWREAGWAYGLKVSRPRPPSLIEVTLPFRQHRRRDPHNYVGTVVKSLVDGFVDAGLWPDDTPEWLSVAEPTIVVGRDAQVVVKITPRSFRGS